MEQLVTHQYDPSAALEQQRNAFLSSLISTMNAEDVVGLWQREKDAGSSFGSDLAETIGYLPEHDLAQARAVYTAMAESPVIASRRSAPIYAAALASYVPDLSVRLLDQLGRDDDPAVRQAVRQEFDDYTDGEFRRSVVTADPATVMPNGLGVTWRDARYIYERSLAADAGFNVHHLGNTALGSHVEGPTE